MTYEIIYRSEEELKDSGIEWLGMIPREWEISQFKRYININSGREILDEERSYDKNINVYGSGGVFKKTANILYSGEATLFGRKGTIGKPIYVNEEFWTVDTMYYSTCSKDFFPKMLYYLLLTIPWNLMSTQTALPSIVGTDIGNLNTVIPNLEQQQKIANFLDHKTAEFDSIISKKELLIEKLEEAKKSLISEVVTGKVKIVDGEFVERELHEMTDSGVQWLGMIPKDWRLMKIKNATEIFRGRFNHRPRNDFKLYENGTYPFIQTGDVAKANKYLIKYSQTLNKHGANVSIKFPIGTLTMTIAANIGDLAIAKIVAFYPDSIVGFYPKTSELNSEYLYLLFSSMKEEFLRNSIINTQANLNIERVGNIKITIGSKTEIDLIVKYLNAKIDEINSIITKTKLQIQKLKQAKQSLISEAVTGKIDLRDWEIQ